MERTASFEGLETGIAQLKPPPLLFPLQRWAHRRPHAPDRHARRALFHPFQQQTRPNLRHRVVRLGPVQEQHLLRQNRQRSHNGDFRLEMIFDGLKKRGGSCTLTATDPPTPY